MSLFLFNPSAKLTIVYGITGVYMAKRKGHKLCMAMKKPYSCLLSSLKVYEKTVVLFACLVITQLFLYINLRRAWIAVTTHSMQVHYNRSEAPQSSGGILMPLSSSREEIS